MNAPRPGYWEIITAFIHEGYRAWKEGDVGYGSMLLENLGLSYEEGNRFMEHLQSLGLAEYEAINGLGAFHLLPRGLALAEGLPSLEHVLAAQTAAIQRVQGPSQAQKQSAIAIVRETLLKHAVQRGVDWTVQNLPSIYRGLQGHWPLLKNVLESNS